MQECQHVRTAFLGQKPGHLVGPALYLDICRPVCVISPHLLIIRGDRLILAVGAVAVCFQRDLDRQARLDLRILRRMTEAQPKDRIDLLRQFQ